MRDETIDDDLATMICAMSGSRSVLQHLDIIFLHIWTQLRYGPLVHCLLYLTKRNHRYRVSHLDCALAYITIWPIIAVIVGTAKFMFGELRPNFIARCFFNGTTGVSKTLSAEELISFDFDINDCPG